MTLSPSLAIADGQSATLAGATVSVTGGTFSGDGDVLALTTTNVNVTASWNAGTETLTLQGIDTLLNYQNLLKGITFASTSGNSTNSGNNLSRTVTWTVNDGAASNNVSTPATTTVNIMAVNSQPVLGNVTASAGFTQGGAATVLAPSLTVTDANNATLAGATIAITGGGFSGDGDVLTATTNGSVISASWSRATHARTLSGIDTPIDYQQVLQSIRFSTSSVNPTDFGAKPTRTITWTLNDGGASNNLSAPASTTVTITPVIPTTTYSWVSLNDTSATTSTTVTGINSVGQIVGSYQDGAGTHGFVDTRGLYTAINDPSGTNTYVQAINASGQIAGYYSGGDGRNHAFIDTGGSFQTFDDPDAGASGNTYALGINDAGDIVGYYYDGSNYYGFLESGGSWSKIDDPLAAHNGNVGGSNAYGINSAGQIAGVYRDSSQIFHGFVDNGGSYITIDDPNVGQFGSTYGAGLNDTGQGVGFYTQNGVGSTHGFVDNAGSFTTLDDPTATSGTSPAAINGSGQIVGTYFDANGPHGFVATPTTVTVASGATVVLPGAYAGTVNFAGVTGTLLVDIASSFAGTVAGQLAIGDVLDFADITAGANATIGYTGNNSPGNAHGERRHAHGKCRAVGQLLAREFRTVE